MSRGVEFVVANSETPCSLPLFGFVHMSDPERYGVGEGDLANCSIADCENAAGVVMDGEPYASNTRARLSKKNGVGPRKARMAIGANNAAEQ